MNRLVFFIAVMLVVTHVWGQTNVQGQKIVSGKVTDDSGEGIPGVNVVIKGTTIGSVTDFDGNYQVSVEENSTLVFSFVGFTSQEIEVGNRTVIDVQMGIDATELQEIVVVGYGNTQDKKDITGAVATVSSKAIAERSVTQISNALQGALSGVVVTRTSSAPGGGNTIRIRGNTTLEGENDPLILVDNVPVENLSSVPPEQVKSISVLKDGAAAAIYGSRAAAGVILVTTKRGEKGKYNISYTTEYFIETPSRNREYQDVVSFMELQNESRWNDADNPDDGRFPIWSEEMINAYKSGAAANDPDMYPNTDWVDLMLKDQAPGVRHQLAISGGNEKIRTNISAGYQKSDAFYIRRTWERYTLRVNNDFQFNEKFGAVADLNLRYVDSEAPQTRSGIIESALTVGQVYPGVWSDGRLAPGRDNGNAYVELLNGGFDNSNTYAINGRLGLSYEPVKNLKFSLYASPRLRFEKSKIFTKPTFAFGLNDTEMSNPISLSQASDQSALTERRETEVALTKQAYINYNTNVGKHNITALAGYEDFYEQNEKLGVRADQFKTDRLPYINQAPTDRVFNDNDDDNGTEILEVAYVSFFGRLNYNYDGRYHFSASVRRDGSSRFGSDYRWGTFPAVSAAWHLSSENFMQSIMESIKVFSFVKLKASYGSLGNDRLGEYLHLTQLQVTNVLFVNGGDVNQLRGLSQRFLNTPDVAWETTITKNFGIELGLFDNRLSLEGQYFIKDTEDMLLSLSVPDLVGFDDPTVNVGNMQTKGFDIDATWRSTIGNDITYSVSLNLSDARSIIGDIKKKRLFDGNVLSEEGHEFRELYGLLSDGLYQTEEELTDSPVTSENVSVGDVRYIDVSGPEDVPDGKIDDFDRVFLGSSGPRYTYGGRTTVGYKNFDFSLVFQGVGKQNFHLQSNLLNTGNVVRRTQEYADHYWSVNKTPEENLEAKYPRLSGESRGNNYRFSDFWLRDGAYLKVKVISLGYNIPDKYLEKVGISGLRIYATGNDLFAFHKLGKGIDPEQTSGFDYFITKTYVMGLNLNF